MWGILRNIIISTEIQKWYKNETFINWLANIFFITSIVVWSIIWWFLVETVWVYWFYYVLLLLIVWIFLWLSLKEDIDKEKLSIKEKAIVYKKSYVSDFLFILKKYYINMIIIWLILVIATIITQKAIEYMTSAWIS